ncbi:MAG: type I methionyl aminopeptidase [Alloprevotella sp.]|nr:type I methionyl aminopeptidase [Alloprevotella sp.]
MSRKRKPTYIVPRGEEPNALDLRVLDFQKRGFIVPPRRLILNDEQIAGIRRAAEVNTGILDMLEGVIEEGMTTGEIDRLVHDYTIRHGGIPAPLNYEGFPKSCCTSLNEVVCHGIPSDEEELLDGDILNVDVTTIVDGYYADASRMFCIGNVEPPLQRLVTTAKECLDIGAKAAKPWGFVGDIGRAIAEHAHRAGFTVVRDLCGHGVGLQFHDDPDVDHYDTGRKGMLLVPGMVFTIEPMLNMGTWRVFIDEEDGWTVVTDDEQPSAQWEHTFLMTENGVEPLSW